MPHKLERYNVPKDLWRNRKLTEDQKTEIRALNKSGKTYRELEKIFGVSYSTIRTTCLPDKLAEYKRQRREKYHSEGYKSSEKILEYKQRAREYKATLIKENKAIETRKVSKVYKTTNKYGV